MNKTKRYNTNANVNGPICILYNQKIKLGESGTISLRKDSRTGEVIESFDIHSNKVLLNVREVILYPSKPLPYETRVYVTVSEGSVLSEINGTTFSGLEEDGNIEFYFDTERALGKKLEGGNVIHKHEGGYYLVESPQNTQINGSWNEISNIITQVSDDTGTTGWYLPSLHEMNAYINDNNIHQNDDKQIFYWTSTEVDLNSAYAINMNSTRESVNKKHFRKIRLFKKVVY